MTTIKTMKDGSLPWSIQEWEKEYNMIPVEPWVHQLLKQVLRNTPPILNRVYEPKLRAAYETGVNGVYLVFIDYGPLHLRGIAIHQEPELQFYLDLDSMFRVISTMVENAITEYDNEKTEVHTNE